MLCPQVPRSIHGLCPAHSSATAAAPYLGSGKKEQKEWGPLRSLKEEIPMPHVWGHRPTGTTPARPVWPTAASKVLFLCQISREGWLPCCGTQTPRKGTEWPALGLQLQTIWAGGVARGDKGGKAASPTALSTGWLRDKQTDTSARFSPLKLKKTMEFARKGLQHGRDLAWWVL